LQALPLPILLALIDKSLLHISRERYDLHELLRQYAEEQLRQSDAVETVVRDTHSAYYANFLQKKWQPLRTREQVATVKEIETEFENVRSAWLTMTERRNADELSKSVYTLWLFCELRSSPLEALTLLKQAEAALRPQAGTPTVDRALGQMLTRQGWFYVSLQNLEEGRELTLEGLSILERVASPFDIALAHDSLCNLEAAALDAHALRRSAEQVARIARQIDDPWLLAGAYFPLANAALYMGDLDEAERLSKEGEVLAEACGDLGMQAFVGGIQADVAFGRGNYDEAYQRSERQRALVEELGQRWSMSLLHRPSGLFAFYRKEYQLAASHYLRGLQILVELGGYEHFTLSFLISIARLNIELGRKGEAVTLLCFITHNPRSFKAQQKEAEDLLPHWKLNFPLWSSLQHRSAVTN
jgi:hypothetical protein